MFHAASVSSTGLHKLCWAEWLGLHVQLMVGAPISPVSLLRSRSQSDAERNGSSALHHYVMLYRDVSLKQVMQPCS